MGMGILREEMDGLAGEAGGNSGAGQLQRRFTKIEVIQGAQFS
jgi:hypothetical protein